MIWVNESTAEGFILLGFSDRPQLEFPLFVVFLVSYIVTIFGNLTIILVSRLDSKLHTPMYFFLTNLSVLDLCYITCTVPQMLVNLGSIKKGISYGGCVAQLFMFLALGATECVLLAVMSFDRFVAICRPLYYSVIMHQRLCLLLAAASWTIGFSNSVWLSALTLQLPLCGPRVIDHFLCEVPALLKLSCVDTTANEAELFFVSVLFHLIPLTLILMSYAFISQAVLKIQSAEGRQKAFGTCGSHLVVVSLFYGTAISMYLQPPSPSSKDRGKMVSLFYGIIAPMLNPLIYTLRNKEVKEAFKRLSKSLLNQEIRKSPEILPKAATGPNRRCKGKIMGKSNDSSEYGFILVGFSDRPKLEMVLFIVNLTLYSVAVLGNSTIILVCILDPRLHTPMYFFLANLSFLDLCFSTSCIPQMLVNLWGPDKTISYAGCVVQLFSFLSVGGIECILLAVMAYDRYVAVCRPLHYMVIMHPQLCLQLVAVAWGSGLVNAIVMSPLTMTLSRCGQRRINHFLCEMPALIKMACVDARAVEMLAFAFAILIVLLPLTLILVSYGYIAAAVLRIKSAAGRWKAFNTCSSHLTVVSLFYGSIIYMYMQPGNSSSQDQGKFLTLFYNLVTPMLNPLIYTLRNKEVKGALKKVLWRQ
ncbi:LOW QUALITY PROTEIN: uncharacterized protein ACOB6Z_016998 [Ctenodactylus gundi]